LNATASKVINEQCDLHLEFVFSHQLRGEWRPMFQMNNSARDTARKKVGLPQVRIHDLKHTFGRRLRAAGVGFEDRQDLLGHKSDRMTTHYSGAEISKRRRNPMVAS